MCIRLLILLLLSSLAAAQVPVPRDLPDSGLEIRQPVHPLRYFDATGRRSAVFGRQTGQFEAWIYPIKLLHGFRLEFRQEGMVEPVRGEAWLEEITTRPESTTFTYVHPLFTVRETIWAPRDEPALVVLLDVDSSKPMQITAKFVPDFKPMWPASLGGQHSYWIAEDKAFGLSDGTGKPTAMIGSPDVGAFTEHMDHSLIGGEMLLQLKTTPEEAKRRQFPIVMAMNLESEQKAAEIYRRVLGRLGDLYKERVQYHRDFLARTLQVETPDAELNRAFTWAKVALDAGWVCHEKYGCGLVAGYGPAGDGERPGFAWWFGGDALMHTWALTDYGDFEGARQAFRFLQARQRADGKMMHEMTQSVDLVDWFGKYGFAYYHADTTPLYLQAIGDYVRRSGDEAFLRESWESIKKAYAYCTSTVTPEDGLMDNTKAGLAAVEVGVLRGKVVKDIYLEGFWVAGLQAMHEMAQQMGDRTLADDAGQRLLKAEISLMNNWWNEKEGYFAFGVDAQGQRADMLGNWPSVLTALRRDFERSRPSAGAERAKMGNAIRKQAETLARPELATDWGDRWLANTNPLYDPISYNNGSVWPFMATFTALAQFRNGAPLAGYATWSSTARLTGTMQPGAVPELMNGDRRIPGERAVPHQLFSSVGVVVPVLRGMLGLEVDCGTRILRLHPHLPPDWPETKLRNLRFCDVQIDATIRQQRGSLSLEAKWNAGSKPIAIELYPQYWVWSHATRINGKPSSRRGVAPGVTRLTEPGISNWEYEPGIEIVPPPIPTTPGERAGGLKILTVAIAEESLLTLAGVGGHTYELRIFTPDQYYQTDQGELLPAKDGFILKIFFDGAEQYQVKKIILRHVRRP